MMDETTQVPNGTLEMAALRARVDERVRLIQHATDFSLPTHYVSAVADATRLLTILDAVTRERDQNAEAARAVNDMREAAELEIRRLTQPHRQPPGTVERDALIALLDNTFQQINAATVLLSGTPSQEDITYALGCLDGPIVERVARQLVELRSTTTEASRGAGDQ